MRRYGKRLGRKELRKRIRAFVVSGAMTLAMAFSNMAGLYPAVVQADGDPELKVGGQRYDNTASGEQTFRVGGTGTVTCSYIGDTYTLNLTNATVSSSSTSGGDATYNISCDNANLVINLVGTNTLKNASDGIRLGGGKTLTITGGSLVDLSGGIASVGESGSIEINNSRVFTRNIWCSSGNITIDSSTVIADYCGDGLGCSIGTTVTLHANDGSGVTKKQWVTATTTSCPLPGSSDINRIFSTTGSTLSGWADAASEGSAVTSVTSSTGDVYAQWSSSGSTTQTTTTQTTTTSGSTQSQPATTSGGSSYSYDDDDDDYSPSITEDSATETSATEESAALTNTLGTVATPDIALPEYTGRYKPTLTNNTGENPRAGLLTVSGQAVFTFKTTSGDDDSFDHFQGAQMDGQALNPGDYDVTRGSTIITLTKEYIDSLDGGTHTLTMIFDDETVTVPFTKAGLLKSSPKMGED